MLAGSVTHPQRYVCDTSGSTKDATNQHLRNEASVRRKGPNRTLDPKMPTQVHVVFMALRQLVVQLTGFPAYLSAGRQV